MGRGKLHCTGFRAQVRLAFKARAPKPHAVTVAGMDMVLRHSLSVKSFAMHLEAYRARQELIFRIVGIRFTSTDRADFKVHGRVPLCETAVTSNGQRQDVQLD